MTLNTGSAVKKKPRGRPFTGRDDPRVNLKGAPKRGDSWAETIKLVGEMDGPSIARLWDTQHKEFIKLPEGITMKQLVVMTVYAALLRDPSPGNWRELMERAEGRVKEYIEHGGDEHSPIKIIIEYADPIDAAPPASGPTDDQTAIEAV